MSAPGVKYEIEVFYDGDCLVCFREVKWLRGRDTDGRIRFTDTAAADFDPGRNAGTPNWRRTDCIQGRLPSGEVLEGMEVYRHLYRIVGFPELVRLARRPGVMRVLDEDYYLFAKYRPHLTARCQDRTLGIPDD